MCPELEFLINQNQKEKKRYIYDNRNILKYDSIIKNGLNLNLKLVQVNELYTIFFFVFSQSKILLNIPITQSSKDLSTEYDTILDSLKNIGLPAFLNKHCIK